MTVTTELPLGRSVENSAVPVEPAVPRTPEPLFDGAVPSLGWSGPPILEAEPAPPSAPPPPSGHDAFTVVDRRGGTPDDDPAGSAPDQPVPTGTALDPTITAAVPAPHPLPAAESLFGPPEAVALLPEAPAGDPAPPSTLGIAPADPGAAPARPRRSIKLDADVQTHHSGPETVGDGLLERIRAVAVSGSDHAESLYRNQGILATVGLTVLMIVAVLSFPRSWEWLRDPHPGLLTESDASTTGEPLMSDDATPGLVEPIADDDTTPAAPRIASSPRSGTATTVPTTLPLDGSLLAPTSTAGRVDTSATVGSLPGPCIDPVTGGACLPAASTTTTTGESTTVTTPSTTGTLATTTTIDATTTTELRTTTTERRTTTTERRTTTTAPTTTTTTRPPTTTTTAAPTTTTTTRPPSTTATPTTTERTTTTAEPTTTPEASGRAPGSGTGSGSTGEAATTSGA